MPVGQCINFPTPFSVVFVAADHAENSCAASESAKIYSSDGPCKGAITRAFDDVFSSCYCKAQVQVGG